WILLVIDRRPTLLLGLRLSLRRARGHSWLRCCSGYSVQPRFTADRCGICNQRFLPSNLKAMPPVGLVKWWPLRLLTPVAASMTPDAWQTAGSYRATIFSVPKRPVRLM